MSRLCFCRLMVTTNFAHDYFIYILFWNDEVFFRCFRHSFSWKEEELQETKGAISFMLTMESGIKIAHFGVVKYCTSLVLFFSLCTASTFITQRTWQKKKNRKKCCLLIMRFNEETRFTVKKNQTIVKCSFAGSQKCY